MSAAAAKVGRGVRCVAASPLPGPAGNVEYFLWLRADAPPLREQDLARAIEEGPAGDGRFDAGSAGVAGTADSAGVDDMESMAKMGNTVPVPGAASAGTGNVEGSGD